MAGTLDDIKVLDLSRAYAGPFCTLLLRDLGAEIIKVERKEGDTVRRDNPLTEGGESGTFIILNRGKKSVTLDVRTTKGREICKQLATKVDVLVENFSPGTMEKLGLGSEVLCALNPRLIYASISGYGHTGPKRDTVAYDPIAQAMGGMTSVTGYEDSPPIKCGVAIADFSAGLYTALAITAAIHQRGKTGEGQTIEISLQDCIWLFTSIEFSPPYFINGKALPRLGSGHPAMAPGNQYMAKDGPVFICTGVLEQVHKLYRLMGRADLVDSPLGANQSERYKYKKQIDAAVEEWTSTKTMDEIIKILHDAEIPASPVPSLEQVCNDPHLYEREMIIEVEQELSGTIKTPGSLFKMSKTPGNIRYPSPILGEHNLEVYSEMLGYTEEELTQFSAEGVI
ncbi:MAG: CoA transferase [Dehalococcoidia bacterium]|jgi:crotonobetainyl-CoA:carnitine CoA-transferase CaiB-like acyl-CoA transferase